MKFYCFFLYFIYSLSIGFAQTYRLNFKRISSNDGLSNNWVRCIYQDDNGFLWFGTSDGLNRYNGYDFKIYRPGSMKPEYISDINVNAICKKSNNELWICTDLGVYTYDYHNDSLVYNTFSKNNAFLCVLEDNKNNFWFGTSRGVLKLDQKNKDTVLFDHVDNDKSSISNNYVNAIFQDSESDIWVGTRIGLNLIRKGTDNIISFYKSEKPNSLPGNNVVTICEDLNKQIWIGTYQNGLAMLEKDKAGNISFNKVLDGHILCLLVDNKNNLWVGKDSEEGLDIINPDRLKDKNGKLVVSHQKYNPIDPKSISDNSIYSIYQDKLNDIWIGTLGEGINYYSPREKKFNVIEKRYQDKNTIRNNHVNAFLEEDNFLWIGTEGGLDRYNKKTGTYTHFQSDGNAPGSLGADAVKSIYKDSRGNLWIATWTGGLNLYNYDTETFNKFLPDENKPGKISNSSIYSICEDNRGNLWVGTLGGGLCRYDYKTNTFRNYLHDEKDTNSISNNSINYVFFTSSGKLYISNYTNLELFNYDRENFTCFAYLRDPAGTKTGKHIISIFEDSKKNIWVATNTGLKIFDETTGSFVAYNTQSLPEQTIQGIVEDSHGNLWISTLNGVSKFIKGINRPENPEFINFTNSDGLSGNEFLKRAAYKNSTGTIYFGSSKGVTYFHPDSILMNKVQPKVVLSELMLLSSKKGSNKVKYTSIIENINTIDKLDLSYLNSNFVITFASLNYLHPENNQYQYKLEGYDEDWIDAGNQRSVSYTNIQPGKYTFIVNGSNNDGTWCQLPKMLKIIIHPPWWRTILFKILLGVIIILIFVSIFYLRLSILKRQNAILEQKVKNRTIELSEINAILEERQEEITIQNDELERHRNHLENMVEARTSELIEAKLKAEEADRLKSSFLANMSHEIRTPMNAIYGFSGLLKDEALSKDEKSKFIDIISDNCESLLVLIDDILDISRIEVDNLLITFEKFDVDEILINLENYFKHNNNKDILFEFVKNERENGLILNNDKVRFRQVFINLLNNAYKFTESGNIDFGYEVLDKQVRFFVSDSGIGIESSEIRRIFDHFYKIENNPNKLYRGTGLGLAISKKIIEMMGGIIWVESVVNKGSVFYFTLPYSNDNLILHKNNIRKEQKMPDLKDFTILVAEDTETNYELVYSMLKRFSAKIIWAQNGQEAIDFIRNNPFIENCIILMDIKMPVVDGYEASRQIKAMNSKIPVIAITAYAQAKDREKILEEKFDAYISKPMKLETLIEVLLKFSEKA
jgi:signal transduction histidine kinase/ligand-binding sensor domain-containing protein/CheY-like chemotaxis protein